MNGEYKKIEKEWKKWMFWKKKGNKRRFAYSVEELLLIHKRYKNYLILGYLFLGAFILLLIMIFFTEII